jgi:hypothetical protein
VNEMKGLYFKPWKGTNYESARLLILSESAYSWVENGERVDPPPSHPTSTVRHLGIKYFGGNKYFRDLGRALCGKESPTRSELEKAWNDCAYSIFVQGTVGLSAKSRPTKTQFDEAGLPFLELLEKIRPLKVVLTGKMTWNHLPPFHGPHLCEDLQACKLSDGSLVWGLAVPHPGNRQKGEGFVWERVAGALRAFRAATFPVKL